MQRGIEAKEDEAQRLVEREEEERALLQEIKEAEVYHAFLFLPGCFK